ncbi:MAG: hypothetical protein ACLGI8_10570 [Acidimicrobiia bacterium]
MDGFSTMYKIMLFLHLVTVVAAFAPMIIHPLLASRSAKDGPGVQRPVFGYMAANGRTIHLPALVLVGVFGLGMVFSSPEVGGGDENLWGFDQAWVSLSLLLWVAIGGIVSGMMLPAERQLASGEGDAGALEKKVTIGGQLVTVLFLVVVYLMIWKPGF